MQLDAQLRSLPEGAWYASREAAREAILAKLEWSRLGDSARQLEDVAQLLRVRASDLDSAYIEGWLDELAVREQWREARHLSG